MRPSDEMDEYRGNWSCQICGIILHCEEWRDYYDLDYGNAEPQNMEAALFTSSSMDWLSVTRALCDPDDEVGQLHPDFRYDNVVYSLSYCPDSYPDLNTADLDEMRARKASDIEVHVARHNDYGNNFFIETPRNKNMRLIMEFDYITEDERVYALVHDACLEMAKKVFSSSTVAHVRDLRGLFTALRWRHRVSVEKRNMDRRPPFPRVNYMLGQNYYYVPQCTWAYEDCDGMQWPGPYGSASENVLYTLSDPLQTEDLTACLLRNLQPCGPPTITAESKLLAENLAKMPTEILDNIFAMMGSDLPRVSSHLLPQAIWKEQLKAGSNGLLPWLWDIDPNLVDEKDAEAHGFGFEWDWELLVRQLSRGVDFGVRPEIPKDQPIDGWHFQQFASTGYHSDLDHVPAGLHNRRRIWQLLEEMFVGDGLPWPEGHQHVKERFTPLFWDKSGRILPSPIWIPLLDFGYDKAHYDQAFHRRLGGGVYRVEGLSKYPLQYWQKQADKSGDTDRTTLEQSATVQEIYGVLRSLGYPV